LIAYVSVEGSLRISIDGGEWQTTELAVVPPYLPHRVISEARLINAIKLEAEAVDVAKSLARYAAQLGAGDAPP
jgi:hypothetical protein